MTDDEKAFWENPYAAITELKELKSLLTEISQSDDIPESLRWHLYRIDGTALDGTAYGLAFMEVAQELLPDADYEAIHRVSGPLRRLKHPAEAYLQKARERNHRRTGLYAKMNGATRTSNPDFDGEGNLREGVELDFDHVPEGNSPDASARLYVDDKESWYRYDRLPSASGLDEEPTGVEWNHPNAEFHRTTVWSGNGQLYVEHVPVVQESGVRSQQSGVRRGIIVIRLF